MSEDDLIEDARKLSYSGPSPDEVTLVEFARERGFSFLSRNDTVARINVNLGQSLPINGRSSLGQSALTTYPGVSQLLPSQEDDLMEFDQSNQHIRHRKDDDANSNTLRF